MTTQSPYIDPMFVIGDIVTVVGKYAGEWQGQKLLITGVEYFPKQKVVKYQTHPADDPTSEGGTDEWTEEDFSMYQHNKWATRATPSSTRANERGDFIAVAFTERMPTEMAWYLIITDATPYACSRAYFDGAKFRLPDDAKSAVSHGFNLFWLERNHTPHPSPQSEMVAVPREVMSAITAALEFYGHMTWLPKWSCSPTTGVKISETETYLSDSIHADKGQRARDAELALQPYTKGE